MCVSVSVCVFSVCRCPASINWRRCCSCWCSNCGCGRYATRYCGCCRCLPDDNRLLLLLLLLAIACNIIEAIPTSHDHYLQRYSLIYGPIDTSLWLGCIVNAGAKMLRRAWHALRTASRRRQWWWGWYIAAE